MLYTTGVFAQNTAPTAIGESYKVATGTTLTVAAPGILANDTDPESDPLTATRVTSPKHFSSLAFNPNGSFAYKPAAGYIGSDSFDYKVSDGKLQSAVVTVNITVTAANSAPTANADTYNAVTGTALVVGVPGILTNDTDPDSDPFTAVLASRPGHGALSFSSNGSFTYTPTAGFSGNDFFTYKASDGYLQSAPANVVIIVAQPITAAPIVFAPGNGSLLNSRTPTYTGTAVAGSTVAINIDGSPIGTVTATVGGAFSLTQPVNLADGSHTLGLQHKPAVLLLVSIAIATPLQLMPHHLQ